MYLHFLITRYGIGIRNPAWYKYKLELFKAITLPSICVQARDRFHWLIVFDSNIPHESFQAIADATSGHSFIHLVPIKPDDQPRMIHGSFGSVYEHCQEYLLAEGIVEDPTEYVITSIVDDDDAWHRDTVGKIDNFLAEHSNRLQLTELNTRRGYLVRHSAGMFMTFDKGIIWDAKSARYERVTRPSISMSVFVFARFSSNISACTVRHGSWPTFIASVDFEAHVLDDDSHTPMWIYVRHPKALSEHGLDSVGELVDDDVLDRFRGEFSLDVAAYKRYLWDVLDDMASHNRMPDADKYELLDLQFRIGALRQQLRCVGKRLTSKNWNDAQSGSRDKLATTQAAASKSLVALLRRYEAISINSN